MKIFVSDFGQLPKGGQDFEVKSILMEPSVAGDWQLMSLRSKSDLEKPAMLEFVRFPYLTVLVAKEVDL